MRGVCVRPGLRRKRYAGGAALQTQCARGYPARVYGGAFQKSAARSSAVRRPRLAAGAGGFPVPRGAELAAAAVRGSRAAMLFRFHYNIINETEKFKSADAVLMQLFADFHFL